MNEATNLWEIASGSLEWADRGGGMKQRENDTMKETSLNEQQRHMTARGELADLAGNYHGNRKHNFGVPGTDVRGGNAAGWG